MLNTFAKQLYKLIPNCLLKYRTKKDDYVSHILYCEKLLIVLIMLIIYTAIVVSFVYYQWDECTNIIDLINNEPNSKEYNYNLLYRDNLYCNIMDGFLIVYLIFLIFTLFLNIVFGILYDYYRKYKNYIFKKNISNFNYNDKIIIHIPLYNEDEEVIRLTLDSIYKLNYDLDNILLMIVIDGIIFNGKSQKNIDNILLNDIFNNSQYMDDLNNNKVYDNTIDYSNNKLKVYTGVYNRINYNVVVKCGNDDEPNTGRMGNRGKKDSALIIYNIINYMNTEYLVDRSHHKYYTNIVNILSKQLEYKQHNIIDYKHMLIIDCDTEVAENGLLQLLHYLKTNEKCIAVCGQTIVKNQYDSAITIIQSFEYFISHILLKTFEHITYNIFVLSGCFTLIKLVKDDKPIVNKKILDKYTQDGNSLYEKNLVEIGEDRYLTTLMIQEYPDNNISYISDAQCFTNVPNKLNVLLDQRRRWTNSLISCLLLLFSKPPKQSLYKNCRMYNIILIELFIIFILPLVIIIGLLNSILSITLQGYSFIPILITCIIILLNLLIAISVLKFNMVFKFIAFFVFLPVFSIIIPWYSILNLDNLKWGLTRDNHNEEPDAVYVNINNDN